MPLNGNPKEEKSYAPTPNLPPMSPRSDLSWRNIKISGFLNVNPNATRTKNIRSQEYANLENFAELIFNS